MVMGCCELSLINIKKRQHPNLNSRTICQNYIHIVISVCVMPVGTHISHKTRNTYIYVVLGAVLFTGQGGGEPQPSDIL